MKKEIFWTAETNDMTYDCLLRLSELQRKNLILTSGTAWFMSPLAYRRARMRTLPYFQYRKQRHGALIPLKSDQ